MFRPGDVFRMKGTGLSGWISKNLTIPRTCFFHHGNIANQLNCGDWEIRESIAKGPAVNRLFLDYYGYYVEIYHVAAESDQQSLDASNAISEIGESDYDFSLFARLGIDVIRLMLQGQFPPYRAEQLKYSADHNYICTEAANYGHKRVGFPLVPDGVVPLPCSIEQSVLDGKLVPVWTGNLKDICPAELIAYYKKEGLWKW